MSLGSLEVYSVLRVCLTNELHFPLQGMLRVDFGLVEKNTVY